MSITRKSSSKSFINNLSDRLQKLEIDRAIAAPAEGFAYVIDPEVTEIEARYAGKGREIQEAWQGTYIS